MISRQDLVYELRWKGISEALSTLEVEELEAEVLWDQEIKDKVQRLKRCIYQLSLNLKRHFKQEHGKRDYDYDKMEKINQVIWEGGDDGNPFDHEINNSIKDIEAYLKPYLKL